MIPVKLSLSGFLSYRQPVELDFTGFDLACISGGNGAGKSSILDAITWSLFGKTRSKDDSFINSHSEKAQVVLEFEYEDNLYRIQRMKERGKTGILEFQARVADGTWIPLTEHTYSETQNRIEQTLKMDYETFVNASFFLQGKADSFAQQNPTKRKEILSNVLGLDIWEEYKKNAANARAGLEREISVIDSSVAEIDKELSQEASRKQLLQQALEQLKTAEESRKLRETAFEALKKRATSVAEQKRLVDLFAKAFEDSQRKCAAQQTYLDERLELKAELTTQLDQAENINQCYQNWQGMKQQLEAFDRLAANFHEVEVKRSAPLLVIEKESSRLQQELAGLEEKRAALQDEFEQLPAIDQQLAQYGRKLAETLTRLSEGSELEKHLQESRELRASRIAENDRIKLDGDKGNDRAERLRKATEAACPLCGQPLSLADRERLITEIMDEVQALRDQYLVNRTSIAGITTEITNGEKQLGDLKKLETDYRATERSVNLLEAERSRIVLSQEDWISNQGERLKALKENLERQSFALEAREQLALIDQEAAALGYDSAAHDRLRADEMNNRECEQQWLDLQKAGARLDTLNHELENLQTQLEAARAETKEREAELKAASVRFEEESADMPDLITEEAELMRIRERENVLRTEVGHRQQDVDVLNTVRQRKQSLYEQREALALKVTQYKLLERAFGKDGVPALLIEHALPEIDEQTNEILDMLSNGAMHVHFETQRQYKDKKRTDRKETLDIMISDASGVIREYEMYSGGEMFRVNFATRLALSKVLAHRAGSRLQTLVIDEGFGSQDAEGRQRLVEAINIVRKDFAKVLVITHLEELKDAFPVRIEVEKTLAGSTIDVLVTE